MASIKFRTFPFTGEAEQARDQLLPAISGGLRGESLTPGLDVRTRGDLLGAARQEFGESSRFLQSSINRAIPRGDIKVRQFLKQSLSRQFARQKESIGREFAFRGAEDLPTAQNLAFGTLSSELGVATTGANIANQSALRRANAPDFTSELAGGIGRAAGLFLGGLSPATTFASLFSNSRGR